MDSILLIKSVILFISSIAIIITAIGLLRFDDKIENVLYARIHMLGVVDMACILALLVFSPLIAITYFILAPFAMHAIANAHYGGEEIYD